MKVFNLAEELEKERKKNKELEERIKEFKLTIRTQFQQIQELIDREDKAIAYLESNEHTCNYVDIYNYALREEDLLNILKGDNK